jgi:hypothetical protein
LHGIVREDAAKAIVYNENLDDVKAKLFGK